MLSFHYFSEMFSLKPDTDVLMQTYDCIIGEMTFSVNTYF